MILKLVRRAVRALGDVQYTEWGERYYVLREGDMVFSSYAGPTVRRQLRDGEIHLLEEGEHPWVYSQFRNCWEPAELPTDATFQDAMRSISLDAQRRREEIRTERRRMRQDRAWARAARR